MHTRNMAWAVAAGLACLASNTIAGGEDHHHGNPSFDYGVFQQRQLQSFSARLFGVTGPIDASSTMSVDKATAQANPTSLITVAKSLRVQTVSADTASHPISTRWRSGRAIARRPI